MDEKNKIDELVAKIDEFMSAGGGRMTVESDGSDSSEIIEVKPDSGECKNMACMTPTLHEGLDRDEDE